MGLLLKNIHITGGAHIVCLSRNCILRTVHGSFNHDKWDFIDVHRKFIGF